MKLLRFETIDSSNTYALKNFDELEDLTAVVADEQTAGRGRFDRTWVSDNCQNIYLSFVLKPEKKEYIANLTQYLSVVTAKIIETYNVKPQIKWPNDVLVNNKKICGILCESSLKNNKIQGVVLGIGINLNMPKNTIEEIEKMGRPATSLNLKLGKKVDKEEFLEKLLKEFYQNYDKTVEHGFEFIKEDYKSRIEFLNKTVYLQLRDGAPKEAVVAKDIDNNGNLIVLDSQGVAKTVLSGDIIL